MKVCKRNHKRTASNSYPDGTCKVCAKERYERNPEKFKKYAVAWQKANPRKFAKNVKKYRKRHPENTKLQKAIQRHRRRTSETKAGGSFSVLEWKNLCKKWDYKCLCCGRHRKLTADHVIPVSKGGTSNIDNIQPLCGPCNSKKNAGTTDYRKIRNAPN